MPFTSWGHVWFRFFFGPPFFLTRPFGGTHWRAPSGAHRKVLDNYVFLARVTDGGLYRESELKKTIDFCLETHCLFANRLKGIAQDINETLNVEGLCRAFPQRLRKLVERDGDRISH
jgi:hypothetical protein